MLTSDRVNILLYSYICLLNNHSLQSVFITVSTVIYDILQILIVAIKLCAVQILQLNSVAPICSSGPMSSARNRTMCYYIVLKRYCYIFQLVIFLYKSIQNISFSLTCCLTNVTSGPFQTFLKGCFPLYQSQKIPIYTKQIGPLLPNACLCKVRLSSVSPWYALTT